MAAQITKAEVDAVYPTVAKTIADALGCDVEEVKPDASLINDLGAESIDFLDLVFRLERAFKVKIPRGKIIEDARGDLPEAAFEQKGVVTEAGPCERCAASCPRCPPTASRRRSRSRTSRACSRRRRSRSS